MFLSQRRPVVYPQAEHARLAATIAAAWGGGVFEKPAVDFLSFVRGVALHDRGYGELDTDAIGETPPERWLEIQRRGFAPRGEDAVVDLVVALHVQRLVSPHSDPVEAAALPDMAAAIPGLRRAARVGESVAQAVDSITDLCDRIAFDICCEEPSEWTRPVVPAAGAAPIDVFVSFDGARIVTITPWPLAVPWLVGVLVGFEAAGYPAMLDPVIEPVRVQPVPG